MHHFVQDKSSTQHTASALHSYTRYCPRYERQREHACYYFFRESYLVNCTLFQTVCFRQQYKVGKKIPASYFFKSSVSKALGKLLPVPQQFGLYHIWSPVYCMSHPWTHFRSQLTSNRCLVSDIFQNTPQQALQEKVIASAQWVHIETAHNNVLTSIQK